MPCNIAMPWLQTPIQRVGSTQPRSLRSLSNAVTPRSIARSGASALHGSVVALPLSDLVKRGPAATSTNSSPKTQAFSMRSTTSSAQFIACSSHGLAGQHRHLVAPIVQRTTAPGKDSTKAAGVCGAGFAGEPCTTWPTLATRLSKLLGAA